MTSVIHVYVARFPFQVSDEKIFPPARAEEIESCSNPDVRRQKYYLWKLLENALMHSFGLKIEKLNIWRSSCGKWECEECCFSLSHSNDFVAVAVSEKPIGVDIEKCDELRFTEALAKRITTAPENDKINSLEKSVQGKALNILWTKKEAVFKLLGNKAFQPSDIETSEYASVTKEFKCEDEQYIITVASKDAKGAVFRCAERLEFVDLDTKLL